MSAILASSFALLVAATSYVVVLIFSVGAMIFASCRFANGRDSKGNRSVCVLVLGDFGRSPRMQYVNCC